MAGIFEMYRVVGMGIKLSTLLTPLSATGRLILTPIPLGINNLDPTLLDTTPALTAFIPTALTGMSHLLLSNPNMLSKPSSLQVSFADLARGSMEFSMVPTNDFFYTFKPCSASPYNNTTQLPPDGGAIVTTATGVITSPGNNFTGIANMSGGVALNMIVDGAPASTNALMVEIVYHLEGVPVQTSGLLTDTGRALIGSSAYVEQAIARKSTRGVFTFLREGAQFLNENKDQVLNLARAVSGLMGNSYAQSYPRILN